MLHVAYIILFELPSWRFQFVCGRKILNFSVDANETNYISATPADECLNIILVVSQSILIGAFLHQLSYVPIPLHCFLSLQS